MKRLIIGSLSIGLLLLAAAAAPAEVKVEVGNNDLDHATPEFKFKEVPSPAKDTAASAAKISIVNGVRDRNGGNVSVLTDGRLPTEEDQPGANFFFNAGTEGGRLLIDLGSVINVKQVLTYSWHVDTLRPAGLHAVCRRRHGGGI